MNHLKHLLVKRGPTAFLQFAITIIGLAAVAVLLWEPQIEGRNANATFFEIYFKDPFLALVYVGSIPFFVALYQTFKIFGLAGQDKIFSKEVIKSFRMIKYSALTIICFVAVAEIIIFLTHGNDDPAGGYFMGLIITFGSLIVAAAATMVERIIQDAAVGLSSNH